MLKLPWRASLQLLMWWAVISCTSLHAVAQNLAVPPNTTANPGSTFSTVTVNSGGDLTASNLTIRPGGGQTGVRVNAGLPATATAVLTDTVIDLSNSGGVTGLNANGSGANLTLQGTASIIAQSNGGGNIAVLAANGGTISLLNTTQTLVGGGGNRPVVAQTGGAITLDSVVVHLSGGGGNGLEAQTSGRIAVSNSEITILGFGGNFGTRASDPGTNVTLDRTTIEVGQNSGGGNAGVQVLNGAHFEATNGTLISAVGSGGDTGLIVQGDGSIATLSDVSVAGGGPSAGNVGINVLSGGVVTGTGGAILATGTGSATGIRIDGTGSHITLIGTSIEVGGANSSGNVGLLAQNSGLANLTDTTIRTTGTGQSRDVGIQLNGSGRISMMRGSIETQGPNGFAIVVSGSGQNQATFDATLIDSNHGTGILAQGSAASTLDFLNGASITAGNGVLLLNQTGNSISSVNLNARNNVSLIGDVDATASAGTTLVGLEEHSTLTGAVNKNRLTGAAGINPAEAVASLPPVNVNLDIDSTSTWNMGTSSTLNTLTVNPRAHINLADPTASTPFRTLVIDHLLGTGGIFGMRVDVGEIKGDLLTVLTKSEGRHLLVFANRNQSTDLPQNSALLVVKTSDGGAGFSGKTDGGTYRYFVVHGDGSAKTPDKNNWYLVRGDEIDSGQVTPVPPNNPNPPPTDSAPGDNGPPPPIVIPPVDQDPIQDLTNTANAAIGSYSAIMPVFYADMGTLIERLGNLRYEDTGGLIPMDAAGKGVLPVTSPLPSQPSVGTWVRGFGSGSHLNNQASRSFDLNIGGFQVGADKRLCTAYGDIYLGAFFSYYYAAQDFLDGGSGTVNAFSVGGYTTFINSKGWYMDLVVKYTELWNNFSTPTSGELNPKATADYSIPTFGGSLEIGKRWDFGKLFVEPQAQISGAWADSVNYSASNGLRVSGNSQTSLRGRLGLRAGFHLNLEARVVEPYAKVSVINEFLGGNTVSTDQTSFAPTLSGPSIQAAAGLTARINEAVAIYGEYDYESGDKSRTPWAVNAGFRWQW